MTPLQQKFIRCYCELEAEAEGKPCATLAAKNAGVPEGNAHVTASRWLANDKIQSALQDFRAECAARAQITVAAVLRRWWEIADADPNELMQVRRQCCRYCNGFDHRYQWTEAEFGDAIDKAINTGKEPPDGMGGFGFDQNADIHQACPECGGLGVEVLHNNDTRYLKGTSRRLYAGAQRTRDGIKILTRDQDAAMLNIARYLGMTIDRKEISGPAGGPVAVSNLTPDDLTDEQLAALIGGAGAAQ